MPVTVSSLYKLQSLNISGNILIDLFDMRHTFDVSRISHWTLKYGKIQMAAFHKYNGLGWHVPDTP